MPEFDADLFVIGGGSGGVRAARISASHGAKVMLAEEFRLGGTCVVRGCIPKKLLVYAGRFQKSFHDARGFGWDSTAAPVLNWKRLIAAKNREIRRLENLYRSSQHNSGVTVLSSRAVLDGPNQVRLLSDGRRVRSRRILIATGARPNLLDIPGAEYAITSNEVFDLEELPRKILVVGAGYIALEFASLFANLGSEVMVVHRKDYILGEFDRDLSDLLMQALIKQGVEFLLNDKLSRVEREEVRAASGNSNDLGKVLSVTTSKGQRLSVDEVLIAIGRSPNTQNLGLEGAGVKVDESGAIEVDADARSSVPSISAVGDVTNRVNLTPVAIREGHSFADRAFGKRNWVPNYEDIPKAVFSSPEIGSVGMTEREALARLPSIDVYKTSFMPLKASLSESSDKSFMKLVVDPYTDRVIGAHVFSDGAAEMVQFLGVMLSVGVTKKQLDSAMAVHPTTAEEFLTLRDPIRIRKDNQLQN